MDKLIVQGGHHLEGELPIGGSKNTALPLMAASILADGVSTIDNVPDLRDVRTFSDVIGFTGAHAEYDPEAHRLRIGGAGIHTPEAPYELVKKMRASFYMLGALLGRFGEARVSLPGGCAWGPRPVDLHIKGMQALGAEIELDQGYVVAKAKGGRLRGGYFSFDPSSVGATVNLMLAASLAKGYTRLENAAVEPDVVVFGRMLQEMGAQINGLGSRTIEIYGVDELEPVDFKNCPDRIELGTFMIAAALAGAPDTPVRMTNAEPEHLGEAFIEAFADTGVGVSYGDDYVDVTAPDELRAVSIKTGVYPGFPTDLQAQWTVMMANAHGNSRIVDTIYYDRFAHVPELQRMGFNGIVLANEVVIEGARPMKGAKVMSTDLRASVSLVLAGMVAEGETEVLRVYHLDRGYEDLEGKFTRAGIPIRREQYDEFAQPATPVEG